MADSTIHIPHGLEGMVNMSLGDNLYIQVTADCNWCFSDPTGVFPAPPAAGSLLPAGSYTATQPPTTYGPFTPTTAGTVHYNAVTSGNCNPLGGPTATLHSIVVS